MNQKLKLCESIINVANTNIILIIIQLNSICFIKKAKVQITSNILTAIHDEDLSVNLPSGSRQRRLLLHPFNINYTVV